MGRGDVSVPGREALVARVEVAPGARAGRHSHPGDEISYVMQGEGTLLIDGEPPRAVKAGESFIIPAGVIHDAVNNGAVPVKLVGVYVVEKGKPLATPAPCTALASGWVSSCAGVAAGMAGVAADAVRTAHLRCNLVRAQPRGVVKHLRGDHQLICASAGNERSKR